MKKQWLYVALVLVLCAALLPALDQPGLAKALLALAALLLTLAVAQLPKDYPDKGYLWADALLAWASVPLSFFFDVIAVVPALFSCTALLWDHPWFQKNKKMEERELRRVRGEPEPDAVENDAVENTDHTVPSSKD